LGELAAPSGQDLAPSTVARCRSTLKAALASGAVAVGVSGPRLGAIPHGEVERIAYLSKAEETRLLAAYSPWAAPVMLVLCETGLRTQEALRLDWRHVDWQRGVLVIEHSGRADGPRTKSKRSRRVGMRPVVRATLEAIWVQRGQAESGPVFLNRRGQPYADTRQTGGNPLAKAHRTACKAVNVQGFRVHEWRHHWAVWFLKRGGNLRALCQIAGPRCAWRSAMPCSSSPISTS
jgi:integrase